jgi:HK97 family phage major capsid protein
LSPGEEFIRSAQYEARNRESGTTDSVEIRTLLTTATTDPAGGLFMPVGTPLPPLRRRMRLFVRDLISVTGTTLNSVPYIRELNPATNEVSATAVAEGTAKPEVTMQFVQADAPIRKIAAWIPITQEIADDAPTLRGYIDQRLAYMLALREEAQILNGNGTAPALRGILQTSGIQTRSAGADKLTTLGLAIGDVENVDGEADGIAMNPITFWTMLTTRSATEYDVGQGATGPFGSVPTGVWGIPVIRTRQVAANKAIVGAWRLGATIFDRESTVIKTTDAHSDYFVLNKLVILAEERLGLAVNRPDLFVDTTLP